MIRENAGDTGLWIRSKLHRAGVSGTCFYIISWCSLPSGDPPQAENQLIIPPMVPLAAQIAMVVRIWFIVPFSPLFSKKETARSTRK